MADILITCISRCRESQQTDQYETITHLGGAGWRWSSDKVIDAIKSRTHRFYTLVDGNRGNIAVVEGPSGTYLRAHADGRWNDNLLSLPACRD